MTSTVIILHINDLNYPSGRYLLFASASRGELRLFILSQMAHLHSQRELHSAPLAKQINQPMLVLKTESVNSND